jgi:drug/metabolite transporter (DMT)-like permease
MDLDVSLDYGLTLLAALLIGTGFVLQQHAAQREPASRFLSLRLMTDLLRTPRWLVGIACMVAGLVLAAWSIGHLSLSFVEPLLATNLVFALVLAVPLAKASVKLWEVLGAAVLCTGVALLSSSRSVTPIGLSFGSVSHWPAAAAIAAIAFVAVQAGRRRQSRTRAMLTGIAAGLIFGIQDALTRQTLQILQSNGWANLVTTWAPYALVGAGAIGIWLMQSAFNAGPLQLSLPAISAGEPLVGILLGVIVFGDRIQVSEGMLAVQAAGIAALVVGVIMVGRAPALSQLRSWAPHAIPHGIVGRHSAQHEDPSANGQSPDPQGLDMRVPNSQHPNSQHPNSQSPNDQHGPSPREQPANGETAHESQPDIRGLPQPSHSLSTLPRRHLARSHHPFHAGERLRPDE